MEQDERRKPYSIGHVTKVTGVNASTLRSWEQQGLIDPSKAESGRRTFGDDDIRKIQEIDRLRRMYGYSLAGIKRALAEQNTTAAAEGADAALPNADEPRMEQIGARVRSLRLAAGLSLRQVAEKTGLAASHLSMFERGVAFPSPSRLNAIAQLFNQTLADLLGGTSTSGQAIIRKGRGRIVGSFGPGVTVEQLTVSEELMDCEVWTLAQGAESEGFYAHEGQELIYVLEGAFELALDGGDVEVLGAGDSAYFNSTRQHRWRNAAAGPTTLLWINTDVKRLASLEGAGFARALKLGGPVGSGLGEAAFALELPEGSRTYRVVDLHTAGHPTRVMLEPLDGLDGESVAEKRESFRAKHDHLRTLLLHEPRGHAATFGLIPVTSARADFGAIFVSSYKYLDMCAHGTIGYARALDALGRLGGRSSFSLEVPAGIVDVHLGRHGSARNVSIDNVASYVAIAELPLDEIRPGYKAAIAYGGGWYANVDAGALGIPIQDDDVAELMELGARIKAQINAALKARGGPVAEIDSTLFYEERDGRSRQLVVLERNKYDRSPCGTGMSARMAELALKGRLKPGQLHVVENVLGVPFLGEVLKETTVAGQPAILPQITGSASLSAFSTLIVEADDPLPNGFLCR
ncbi:proline racemase family protein [Segnochrobactrum spirostomi]|uniref:4-hydroxyproline epimerase n=1 Tax=Segnochrobactrum spirostomi TaxID=2608987 RepID=A0A6A7Y6V8_9HYPH|nr:proline racemase family protein [Segnochrobactrum spirostomi]MQT15004.1 MerR family transcriptional regulator [Segnochrobactrum spirostomi]